MIENDPHERRALIKAVNLRKKFILTRLDYFYFPLWAVSVRFDTQDDEIHFGELHRSSDDALQFLAKTLEPFIQELELWEVGKTESQIEIGLRPQIK